MYCASRSSRLFCSTLIVATLFLALVHSAFAATNPQRVRVSSWYWLNSVPKSQWPADFRSMKAIGLTDVVLVWGLDAAAFSTRTADSHEAMRDAYRAGLGSYLFVWHARHNALPHDPQFQQVDAAGHTLFAFDAFDPQWRGTQWKSYLQTLASEYRHEPGMAGYIFDNSFAIGDIGAIDGPTPSPADNFIAYGPAEQKLFGKPLPRSPKDADWNEWIEARQQWWAEWASDTQTAIRAIDPDPRHRIILEDGANTIDPDTESRAGLSLAKVIPYFDAMSAYWAPDYLSADADQKLAAGVTLYLAQIQSAIGRDKPLTLSLRLSDGDTEDTPGHATKPTVAQIQLLVDAALRMGVRAIDLYGYRMGVYHLDGPGWHQFQPGAAAEYPLTGQIEGKFLADRTEVWPALRNCLRHIEAAPVSH